MWLRVSQSRDSPKLPSLVRTDVRCELVVVPLPWYKKELSHSHMRWIPEWLWFTRRIEPNKKQKNLYVVFHTKLVFNWNFRSFLFWIEVFFEPEKAEHFMHCFKSINYSPHTSFMLCWNLHVVIVGIFILFGKNFSWFDFQVLLSYVFWRKSNLRVL